MYFVWKLECLFKELPVAKKRATVILIKAKSCKSLLLVLLICISKKKVEFSRYWPGVVQRVGRGIALLFHDRSTRRGWVVSSTPRPHLPLGKNRYPFYRRLSGPQGRSGREENLVPTGIRSRTVQAVVSRYTDWTTRLMVCICSYLKSVLRYKYLTLDTHHPNILYLRERRCEDPWLFFEARRGPQANTFGERWIKGRPSGTEHGLSIRQNWNLEVRKKCRGMLESWCEVWKMSFYSNKNESVYDPIRWLTCND